MNKEYKILVVSDSHGDDRNIKYALDVEWPVDALIHCGDMEHDIRKTIGEEYDIDIYSVTGNCDFYLPAQSEILVKFGYYKVLVVHGHEHGVKYSTDRLYLHAKEKFADVVLYGHSHVPDVEEKGGILIANPGSISYPRQFSRNKSYAVLTISDDKMPGVEIHEIED